MSQPELSSEQMIEEQKKQKQRDYMREYSKKRYHEKKEETAARLEQKKLYYQANKEHILTRVKGYNKSKKEERDANKFIQVPMTTMDLTALQHYYYRCLLLDPAAVSKMLIELGVPDMPDPQIL
jgi:hypothetical protein